MMVGNESNKESFKIHQTVLFVRCRSLYNELQDVDHYEGYVKELRKPDIPINVFRIIIQSIYGDSICLNELEAGVIFNLMRVSIELGINKLTEVAESHLIMSNGYK
ncbi:btb/poz domain-containing protein 9 [Gigaspora margarita]|uniref:Btb/poz domain-containing protein 9 n=1 Tax=Gigaspora margarita TaxID=4874 RepID=A0A8H4AV91_GIGMA|nr:btb/poz domain-containing protein 9 [Gigaspora margarita]